jgi:hypothetical protein
MTMNMNHIVMGYEGKVDMLRAVFGSEKSDRPSPKPTPNAIRDFARTHNAVTKARKKS